jgi:hypothetical protein
VEEERIVGTTEATEIKEIRGNIEKTETIKLRLQGPKKVILKTEQDLHKIGTIISSSQVYKNRKDGNFRLYVEMSLD